MGHVGWIVVTVIAWLKGVGHVGWIVVTAIPWFRVWDTCGGFWLRNLVQGVGHVGWSRPRGDWLLQWLLF